MPVGKASFDEQKLLENAQAMIDAINRQRPASVKGIYIRRIVLAPTMGPGVRVESIANII